MSQIASTKSKRVNLRLNSAAKKRLEQAASVAGKTVSGFILASALENADKVIQQHEKMVLSHRDAEIFFNAILNPPKPNPKLRKALEDHSRHVTAR